MSTNELTHLVAYKAGISLTDSKKAIEATVETIADALKGGEEVKVYSFGTFNRRHKDERNYRDPKTGERRTDAAHNVPVFLPAQWLKDHVNEGGERK